MFPHPFRFLAILSFVLCACDKEEGRAGGGVAVDMRARPEPLTLPQAAPAISDRILNIREESAAMAYDAWFNAAP